MTRDEQIAQLKPGDKVIVRTSHQAGLEQALFLERRGDWFVYRYDDRYSAQLYCRRLSDLILPEPPPKPKAVPGVRYERVHIGGYKTRGVGLRDGRVYVAGYDPSYDFDPAVWTPIDDVKVGE